MSAQAGRLGHAIDSDQLATELHQSATGLSVVHLSPTQAGALLVRLAELEAMEQRAQEAYDSDIWINGKDAARYILTGEDV